MRVEDAHDGPVLGQKGIQCRVGTACNDWGASRLRTAERALERVEAKGGVSCVRYELLLFRSLQGNQCVSSIRRRELVSVLSCLV